MRKWYLISGLTDNDNTFSQTYDANDVAVLILVFLNATFEIVPI